jgi:enamine deaminase RidA (YjgF/YER057c/UK114 family)
MNTWLSNRSPEPPHPFAHSIANDQWVIVSGMVGVDLVDGSIPGSVTEQVELAWSNITRLLEAAGSGLHEVVYVTTHASERAYDAEIDAALRTILPEPRAAGGAFTIVGLADERMKVEFDVWASRGAEILPQTGSAGAALTRSS